jgi:hypothetical protein
MTGIDVPLSDTVRSLIFAPSAEDPRFARMTGTSRRGCDTGGSFTGANVPLCCTVGSLTGIDASLSYTVRSRTGIGVSRSGSAATP